MSIMEIIWWHGEETSRGKPFKCFVTSHLCHVISRDSVTLRHLSARANRTVPPLPSNSRIAQITKACWQIVQYIHELRPMYHGCNIIQKVRREHFKIPESRMVLHFLSRITKPLPDPALPLPSSSWPFLCPVPYVGHIYVFCFVNRLISSNRITSVDVDAFNGLTALKYL